MPAFPFTGVPTRRLTLNEDFDEFGRLIQTMGTFDQNGVNNQGLSTWGRAVPCNLDREPEGRRYRSVADHESNRRHPSDPLPPGQRATDSAAGVRGDPGNWSYAGEPMPPDPNEIGWKETVRMNPGEITTVIMQFNLPNLPTTAMRDAVSPRTGGKEYVWHCHILEHEEHDMMRPLVIE